MIETKWGKKVCKIVTVSHIGKKNLKFYETRKVIYYTFAFIVPQYIK